MDVELLVEGYTDEVFLRRCLAHLGINVSNVYGKKGVPYIKKKAAGFAVRGQYSPILILADLADMDGACVVNARNSLVPAPPPLTLVRLAVREIESWLMASRIELARYLGIPIGSIPSNPDEPDDPKQSLVNLARISPRGRIREMFVPKIGVSSVVGRGYVEGFSEFMDTAWSLNSAVENSASFGRFVQRVSEVHLAAA